MTTTTNIQRVLDEGRLTRNQWSGSDDQGRQLLCLYTAWRGDPEARPGACPASEAPLWFARLMPWIDDAGSAEKWPSVVQRVAALEPQFARFGRRELIGCLKVILEETLRHVNSDSCRSVLALCERELAGDAPTAKEWAVAAEAAAAAAVAAEAAAVAAVAVAAVAVAAVAVAVAVAVAAVAVAVAAVAVAVAAVAAVAVVVEAADRIIDGMLTVLEACE